MLREPVEKQEHENERRREEHEQPKDRPHERIGPCHWIAPIVNGPDPGRGFSLKPQLRRCKDSVPHYGSTYLTTPVAALVAEAEPKEFVALTVTVTAFPASPATGT
jgi:hypothetical protein